jgi:hypothetical protein
MLIGMLAGKSQENTYLGHHCLSTRCWNELCGGQLNAPSFSESQLRERLKKSASTLEAVQDTFIKFFHQSTCHKVVSAEKMMIQARGPVWHREQQQQG